MVKFLQTPRVVPIQHLPAGSKRESDSDTDEEEEHTEFLGKVLRSLDLINMGLSADALKALTSAPLIKKFADRMSALQALHPGVTGVDDPEDDKELPPPPNAGPPVAGAYGVQGPQLGPLPSQAGSAGVSPSPAVATNPPPSQIEGPARVITVKSLASYCKGRERKACDYFGHSARHTLLLLKRLPKHLQEAFEDIVRRVANGDVQDPTLISMLRHIKGHPIGKGDGGIRPAGSTCILMYLASGVLMRSLTTRARDAVGWGNVAVGVPGGGDALSRYLQSYAEQHLTHVIIKCDIRNFHNAVRKSRLQRAAAHLPDIAPITRLHYGGFSIVTYVEDDGTEHNITVYTGGVQGDSKMAYLGTKALNDVLNRFRPDQIKCVIVGFADDTYICGPVHDAIKAVNDLGPVLKAELDVEFNIAKFAAYVPAGPTLADIEALLAAKIPSTDGINAAGTPVGSLNFVTEFLKTKVEALRTLTERIVALKKVEAGNEAVSLQGLFAIIRLCIPASFSHLLRTVYPSIIAPFAKHVDDIVLRAALSCSGHGKLAEADVNDPELCRVSKRVLLPTDLGGLGIFSCFNNMHAAFLGSASLTCETVSDLGRKPPAPAVVPGSAVVLGPQEVAPVPAPIAADAPALVPAITAISHTPPESQYLREHKDSLAAVQARIKSSGIKCAEIEQWTVASIFKESVSGRQRYISQQLALALQADILASFDKSTPEGARSRAVFQECSVPKAGAWITASPRDYYTRMYNGEWYLAVAARLDINPYPEVHPSTKCDSCKDPVGPSVPSHAIHCSAVARRAICMRHSGLKAAFAKVEQCAEAGTWIIIEPFVQPFFGGGDHMPPSDPKFAASRADIGVRAHSGANYVVDVTIIDATLGQLPNTYIPGKATDKAFNDKVEQYTTRFKKLDACAQLRVAAFDTRGGPSKGTLGYMKSIISRESKSKPLTPKSVIAARVYSRISVAIQRAIAYNTMEYRLWRVPAAYF